ncbi:HEXXH motif domain-containing protein [Streptomyces viridiviolaceus]|uniref:HEXXH motif domain-containing protein n=1 Tax=Streptomyces viridiviolaceus TaxID=68282 RepID=A0ABW2E6K3_9ACTN|nr:HEXXH motif domain-containing protein [Streptomyces viridiviolaceus]GHB19251.1 HEXXH motif domain-containing protein [Streptomyces viridiviolaceus]
MTSEEHHAPFRMPDRLFDELGTGGGSKEAVFFLERAERSRRLLLLRTLLDRLDSLPTPLSPAAEAWSVLKAAAERAPEAVDRLLLAPATGGWIAHVLRRLHGTATGPPLWAEAGRLSALAVAASLHAGTRAELLVPLLDGAVHFPGLGTARLGDVQPGATVGRAEADQGRLSLSWPVPDAVGTPGRRAVFDCRPGSATAGDEPAAGDGKACWTPLRTLTHGGPPGLAAIPLDDLDPYRDLDEPAPPARLDADEAAAWQDLFGAAVGILSGAGDDAGPGRLDPAVIRSVVPWGRTTLAPPPPPDVRVSASSGDSYGAMLITRPGSALALAETLVHEFQHSKLAALLHLFRLVDDDREERFYAPWRADPRHLTGLLHGAYAFTGVAGFWRDRLAEPAHADIAAYHFALRRLQSRLVVRTLLASARLTAAGHRLVTGLARTLDDWLREPVDRAALARARTAAALHRTEWRLRNVAAPADPRAPERAALRFRADRRFWPDTRTHAFATRPVDPRTPDDHLAAGDPATALDGYERALARDPADARARSGWIVARAALNPGPSTRRLLARPELFQPQRGG